MLGGPVGAMLGVALGHNFDLRWLHRTRLKPAAQRAYEAFFTTTCQVMGYLAKANGRVSEQEIDVAQAVMVHLGLTPTQKRTAIVLFNEGKQAGFVLDAALSRCRMACAEQVELLRKFIKDSVQHGLRRRSTPSPGTGAALVYLHPAGSVAVAV